MVVQVHPIRMCNYQSTKYNFAQDLDIIPKWVWPTGTKTTVFVQSAGKGRHEVADIRTPSPPLFLILSIMVTCPQAPKVPPIHPLPGLGSTKLATLNDNSEGKKTRKLHFQSLLVGTASAEQ